jgi:hypothetical protein
VICNTRTSPLPDLSVPQKLIVQMNRPGKVYEYGRIAEGWWILDPQGFVHLTTESGVKLGVKRKCPDGIDAKVIACLLLKQQAGKHSNDFNRKLSYDRIGY